MTATTDHGGRVSVVIPTYNRAHLLPRALRSVLGQSYANLEVIVVDDGSTDATPSLFEESVDPRVRYVRQHRNQGGGAARNTGIAASAGEFVAFLDSDDEWLPGKLERQVERFRELPEDVALVYTGSIRVYDDGSVLRDDPVHRGWILRDVLAHAVVANTSTLMVRRSVLTAVGGFDEDFPAYQDVDFWARIAARFQVDFASEVLVRTHVHREPVRISNDHARRIRGREMFYRKHTDAIERLGVSHLLFREIARIYQRGLLDDAAARRFYRRSIASRRSDPRSYVLLLSTYFPRTVHDAASASRRWLRRIVRGVTGR